MTRTILVTGATDGIGKLTARMLLAKGHRVLVHGRSPSKLAATAEALGGDVETFVADLADFGAVDALASQVLERHPQIDVVINNAGVFKTARPQTRDGLDVRFVVNALAPYLLTQRLLSAIPASGRIVNVSSAAQAPVHVEAMAGRVTLDDMGAYAQSKLALTIWSRELAHELPDGPVVVAVNPGSLLASKMVREGFGVAGSDLSIGATILCQAALDDRFADATGKYWDNDTQRFRPPQQAAMDRRHATSVMEGIRNVLTSVGREVT